MERGRSTLEEVEAFERGIETLVKEKREQSVRGRRLKRIQVDFQINQLLKECQRITNDGTLFVTSSSILSSSLSSSSSSSSLSSSSLSSSKQQKIGSTREKEEEEDDNENGQTQLDLKEEIENERDQIKRLGIDGFYEKKRKLDEFFSKYPQDANVAPENVTQTKLFNTSQPSWSGEERHGKYLDLHKFYNSFINLKDVVKKSNKKAGDQNEKEKAEEKEGELSYLEYLDAIGNLSNLRFGTKSDKRYLRYLKDLLEYLVSFHGRSQALIYLDFDKLESKFNENWSSGTVLGWKRTKIKKEECTAQSLLEKFKSNNDLLAQELSVRGAKGGGTTQQRAERLAFICNCEIDEKPKSGKKLKKAMLFNAKEVALMELKVSYMVDTLNEFLEATKQFITRKQTLTYEELAQEEEEERLRDQGVDDDDDELYNIEQEKRKDNDDYDGPVDQDGRPIPLWLYKLHGLGVEYNCEICGNHKYAGRRAFEKHFQEWRHLHGMNLLGIPNTRHFHNITKIAEARSLHSKLQQAMKEPSTQDIEQVEDDQGNVYSRKTYEDLKKQGLV